MHLGTASGQGAIFATQRHCGTHGNRLVALRQPVHHGGQTPPACRPAVRGLHVASAFGGRRAPQQQQQSKVERGLGESDELQMWMDRLMRLQPTTRSVALLQLLRIEEEGAYAGLVGGSPGAAAVAADDLDGEGGLSSSSRGGGAIGADAGFRDRQGTRNSWSAELEPRHARMVTELVSGTTRWRRRLDYTLAALLKGHSVASLDAPVRNALRLALYELVELQNAQHGVVNSYVDLVKGIMHIGAGNLTNGVLRNVTRGLKEGSLPQPQPPTKGMSPEAAAEALAIGASHPTWLVAAWLKQYGPAATMALLKYNNSRPRYSLRLAPGTDAEAFCRKLAENQVRAEPSRYLPSEYVTVDTGLQSLLREGLVQRGEAQVQDEAAGLVVALLDPQPGESLLDACAAPGGKTLFAAARMRGQGTITALDLSASRLEALRRAAERQPDGRMVKVCASDLRRFATLRIRPGAAMDASTLALAAAAPAARRSIGERDGGSPGGDSGGAAGRQPWHYDRVLLDAPCSGTGVLAKRADMRWRRTPAMVAELAALQSELLNAAAVLVAPGGLLVYSTCSIEAQENQDQLAAFLKRHPEYALEPPSPSAGLPPQCLSPDGCLRMLPHQHGTDGAFAARLRRQGAAVEAGEPTAAV
ncbi:hypothetical protein D9Q98_010569 [Chlorella vulgaris]|uniref:SAM-dependent MTase RsmB/NOP-type domain-containing protein n=1 Tax=Chlorella vulgaris TaxID=3077 RepID=A0A9D4TQN6_CHLVU|nr:hypothetical protein D9Q98_010569 [Chlorella vulgaris]